MVHGLDYLYYINAKDREITNHLSAVVETQQWNQATTERKQVFIALEFCNEAGYEVSQFELARFFRIPKNAASY